MENQIKIIGIYKIISSEPCHLIEIEVQGNGNKLDIGSITQEIPNESRDNWQAPYLEHILDGSGENILADDFRFSEDEYWEEDIVRIAFFFHYLHKSKPLITPYGNIDLPEETKMPERLKIIKYEPVD